MTRCARNGATPIAIASATMPSIRPIERFFDGLRLPVSSELLTEAGLEQPRQKVPHVPAIKPDLRNAVAPE
jgi:hypothetical protein